MEERQRDALDDSALPAADALASERRELLQRLDDWLETPMLVLAFVWLTIFVYEMVYGLGRQLDMAGQLIWGLFVFEFGLGFTVAPQKLEYLKHNWLKAIALLAPALRVFRVFRVLRITRLAGTVRGLRLLRVIGALNRGMNAFGAALSRRGFGYIVGLTMMLALLGAAGMYAFERAPAGGLDSYWSALWWTAMLLTSMGSEYWPRTAEGRALCLLLALYGFAVFGYVTATLATFFIGRDAENETAEVAGAKAIAALQMEISALREEIRKLGSHGT
jgi:voltage-gated potassium channel